MFIKLNVIETYMETLDLDADFEDEKNDFRDRLFRGVDIHMESTLALLQHFTDKSKPVIKGFRVR